MKLCSQCEFIYEDDQEHCDMDGAQLVYEPTLEHVFPNNTLQARTELEQRVPARLVIPLSRLPQPQTSIARRQGRSNRSRLVLQIGAVAVLTVVSFMAFYATPRLFQAKSQTAKNTRADQKARPEISSVPPIAANAAVTSEKPETRETKLNASRSSNEPETRNPKLETAFPALPGLKPMPRLKPLPTLKPIPRLADRSRSVNTSRKAIVVNTSGGTKKDSRFGSFLKRTGRILTKPFKS